MTLVIADPWDLVGPDGKNQVAGVVERTFPACETTDRDTVVLRLSRVLTYQDVRYDRVVLQAKDDEPILELLTLGRPVEVSVYGIPVDQEPPSIDPEDWWRGGLGATASAIPT